MEVVGLPELARTPAVAAAVLGMLAPVRTPAEALVEPVDHLEVAMVAAADSRTERVDLGTPTAEAEAELTW